MIRSALSLLAKKTAIVAVSGVVVIGGAGFALAELDEDAPDTSCDVDETTDTDETTDIDDATDVVEECVDDTTTSTEGDDTTTTTEAEDTTTTSEPEEDADADDDADDADEVEEPEATATLDATADDADEIEELDDDSHGAMVSEAAKTTCWEAENLEAYGNHGQCVRAFAHGEGVDHSAEAVTEDPAKSEEDLGTPTVDTTETETLEVQQAESSKPGKGNGGGKGNGKGKKG